MSQTTKFLNGWLCALLTCVLALSFCSVASAQVVRYVHTDGLGSASVLTDTNRNVIERREYEPYGANLGSPVDGVGYTGHVMDAATGLTYMQQRYYDPLIGLMLSIDPVTAYQQPITNFCRYCYARNNPYLFTDPDGRQSWANTGTANPWPAVREACDNNNACEQRVASELASDQAEILIAANGLGSVRGTIGVVIRQVRQGTSHGERAYKRFTPAGKREVIRENREAYGGQTRCEGCGQNTIPAKKSESGVPTPHNETRVDHIHSQSRGGDGSPSNGQVLCSSCNLEKSNKPNWIRPLDRETHE